MIKEMKGNEKIARKNVTRVIAFIVVFALVCALTAFAASPEVYNVDIYDGNTAIRVETNKNVAADVVLQAEILLNEDDVLNLDRFAVGEDSIIIIYRAADIEFTLLNGKTESLRFAGTVEDLLKSKSVELGDNYKVNYPLSTQVENGMKIVVDEAYTVFVTADGITSEYKMGNGTVDDVLLKAGITLGEDDEVTPAADTKITDGLEITVDRVEYLTREQSVDIEFAKKIVKTDTLYVGTSKIIQKGENGSKTVTYKDKYVNGELVSSTVINEVLVKAAVDQIKSVGTKHKAVTVSAINYKGSMISELSVPSRINIENGVPTNYKRIVTGKASAYNEPAGSITASGRAVKPGYIAVDPKQFPYGTELWVVSNDGIVYGYCIAADTGGFVHRGKFTVDLFMNSEAQCVQWGARDVTIYVL